MTSIGKFQHTQGIILLVAVTIFWGTTFPLVKETIVSLSPGTLIAIRCALAGLAFAVHLRHLNMPIAPRWGNIGTAVVCLFSNPGDRP